MTPEIWRNIFDAIENPIFLHDAQFRVMLANRAYWRESGMNEAEALGKPYWEVFPRSSGPLAGCEQAGIEKFCAGNHVVQNAGGQHFLSTAYAVRDVEDKVLFSMHVLTNITQISASVDVTHAREKRADKRHNPSNDVDVVAKALKNTAHELWRTDNDLPSLMDSLPTPVIVHGPDAKVRYLNHAAAELLGLAEGQTEGDWRLISKDGLLLPLEEYPAKRVITDGKPFLSNSLGVIPREGAKTRWVLIDAYPDRDAEGALRQVIVCFVDITKHRLAEEQLQKRTEEFTTLANNAIYPITRYDREGRRLYVNPAMSRLSGERVPSLVGQMITDTRILSLKEAEKLLSWVRQVVETGQLVEGDLVVVDQNGRLRYYHNRLAPEWNQSGVVESVLSVWAEITERIETLRRLHTVVENLPDMVALYDPQGVCLYVNSVTMKLFDSPPEAFLGKTILDLAPPAKRELYQKLLDATLQAAGEGTPNMIEVSWPLPTGVRDWEVRYTPEKNESGVVTAVLSIARDISDQKRAEKLADKLNRELKLRLDELMQQSKDMESLSYSMAHDLNTPLRAIDGFIRILLEEYGDQLDAEANRYLSVVRSSVARMERLLDSLLDYISLSRLPMRMEPVDMSALAREVFEDLRTAEPERNIQLVLGEAPVAHCDRTLIRRVLANLIGNAVKFTKSQTKALIEIGGSAEGTENVYYVKDNGVGFDMRFEAKLFGVFERLHGVEEFEGAGMGLAAVKRIIERHKGRVWAKSTSGQGTAIHFSIPIAIPEVLPS